jgi:hypothetical protein
MDRNGLKYLNNNMERMRPLLARPLQCGLFLSAVFLLSAPASAGPVGFLSYTGALSTPQSVLEATFTLTTTDTITFQTWGFGGGTNAAGSVISPGGFDSLIALFSGSGPTATIVTDGSGDVLADADNLNNPPFSPVGNCPPAGTVTIGTGTGSALCGDDYMQAANLAAGIYTLVLSTADYIPNAVNPGAPGYFTIGDGFTDFSGPATGFGDDSSVPYQTCNFTSNQPDGVCIDPDANYAVDIVSTQADLTNTPEPGAMSLLGVGLAGLAAFKQFKKRRLSPHR